MKKRIRDIAEIRTGYQFRGRVEATEDANVAVIQIKDFDDRRKFRLDELAAVRLENTEPYRVATGDVLFLSRGHHPFAAVVPELMKETIATGYFFILHPHAILVRPAFLAWSLNQPEFQESLKPFTRGTHMPMVSRADFQDLTVFLPPLLIQDRILELQQLVNRERDLTARLQQKRGELVRAVARELQSGRLQRKDN